MGTQKGPLRLKGTHGDFTFVETRDGFLWKKKIPSITMDRITSDPAFTKTLHHISEFSRAGKAVKLIREAFENQLKFAKDRRLTARLQTVMVQVVKSDNIHDRGKRLPQNGNFQFLEKFEINGLANLHHSIQVPISISYNRATGEITADLPSFIPTQNLNRASNVTDFKIVCAAAELDFENDACGVTSTETAFLPIGNTAVPAINLSTAVTPGSTLPVIIVMGIQFSENVNGFAHPEINGAFNALTIMKTDQP